MDSVKDPYSLGVGSQSPELAGRNETRGMIRGALARVRAGRTAKSVLMKGLRNAGNTILLDRIRDDAEAYGIQTMQVEAPESQKQLAYV